MIERLRLLSAATMVAALAASAAELDALDAEDAKTIAMDAYVSLGAAKEANWLRAPAEAFLATLRLYRPQADSPSTPDGPRTPPQIVTVD